MRATIGTLLIAALACVCDIASANVTYDVNIADAFDNQTLTGTITTDGASGPLSVGDFVSWSLSASGVVNFTGTSGPPFGICDGPALCGISAIGNLLVNTAPGFLELNESPGLAFFEAGHVGVCLMGCYVVDLGPSNAVATRVASVPEPATGLLLAVGLACLGWVIRRGAGRGRSPSGG